jgi:heptosyltransferase I
VTSLQHIGCHAREGGYPFLKRLQSILFKWTPAFAGKRISRFKTGSPTSFCLVRLSALGDVLMFLPLVRALQDAYPKATITWVISLFAYNMVKNIEGVEFIVVDKPRYIQDYWRFRRQLKGRTFDVLLACQASFRANLLYPCIRAHWKIGYDKHKAKDGHRWFIHTSIPYAYCHTLEGFLKFGGMVGAKMDRVRWDIPMDHEAKAWAMEHMPKKGPIVVINPAASKEERSWLCDRYIALIQSIRQKYDASIVLIGGPGEQDRMFGDAITQAVPESVNLIGKTKPIQLLEIIRMADLVICPDTGPAHMAAAVGTKVIGMHAVTDPYVSGAYGYQHMAVNAYPMALETIGQKIGEQAFDTKVREKDTMALITVDMVMEKLERHAFKDVHTSASILAHD